MSTPLSCRKIESSQNTLEEEFLINVSSFLSEGVKIVQIAGRGYAKSRLLKNHLKRRELFIIRGRKDVMLPIGKMEKLTATVLGN